MILVKATPDTEAELPPTAAAMAEMEKFGGELMAAGVGLDGAGLRSTKHAARVHVKSGKHTVVDGPFAEAKELVAGYSIWECKSLAEAIEWGKRFPLPEGGAIEIRPLFMWSEDELRK